MVNGQPVNAKLNPGFISDDIDIIAKIAVNGGGIARLASFVAQPLIDSGLLKPLYWSSHSAESRIESLPMNIYACVTERSALNSKVRTFIEFIEGAI